ncbi:hypothetical protein B0T18DRAFT_53031 [Schizothecium vesticola]|uniref:Uncharacterized protein n=1 Tax=Schizothecium vesticola TaxID=314040 RepID=A0AA40FC61_9PEZI|nr:hypothetical protein B0T18DRAFT_53031 [Schizothecium vesticola]
MTTVFHPSLSPSLSARHWRVQWADVVPAENDDGKSDGVGFSPINALLPLPLTRASYFRGTGCVELKGSFADPALYRSFSHVAHGQHETGTRQSTMAGKAPNRVASCHARDARRKGRRNCHGIWRWGGGGGEQRGRRCNLARLSGGAEPVHGASWRFGLGGVSHVGGDATAREICPRLGGSVVRSDHFLFGLPCGTAMTELCIIWRRGHSVVENGYRGPEGERLAAGGTSRPLRRFLFLMEPLPGLPQRASRSIGPLGGPMIRGGVGGVGVGICHDGRASRLSGFRAAPRPRLCHTRCAVDPEIPGNSSRGPREPRMAWTVQGIIKSCTGQRAD